MDIATIIKLVHSIQQDGALEREDWLLVLPLMKNLLAQVELQVRDRWLLVVALKGCQTVLDEIVEYLEEMED
jgi:hypothetical protein